jgi:hypothetical protein
MNLLSLVPIITMLPLFRNIAYTYTAWGWCLLIYFDERYLQFNLINFISLNIGFQIMMCMDKLYIQKYISKYHGMNYTLFFTGHFVVHYIPMHYLYKYLCSVNDTGFHDYGLFNVVGSLSWCVVCNSNSFNMSNIYIEMSITKWYILWLISMVNHLVCGFILTRYKNDLCLN